MDLRGAQRGSGCVWRMQKPLDQSQAHRRPGGERPRISTRKLARGAENSLMYGRAPVRGPTDTAVRPLAKP